ncbi:MAG: 3'-5' exonuclease, partial [Pirellulaceae bacterium]|nr:3'-5' exonuclease [Pirellulaceae bacterium]
MAAVTREVQYLLFDVESVAEGALVATSRYAGENLSPEDALAKFRQELVIAGGKDFIPYTYHIPVAIVIAKIRPD